MTSRRVHGILSAIELTSWVIAVGIAVPCVVLAESGEPATASRACEKFAPQQIANGATLTLVQYEAAKPGRSASCIVRGKIVTSPSSTINFRLDLPDPGEWNKKLLTVGGGGFDGFIPTNQGAQGRRSDGSTMHRYAIVSSDSGHQGRGSGPYGPAIDFSWAAGNPTAVRNHGYAANHLVLWSAVSLVKAYYGQEPIRRYMSGGSNGGRSGLMAAQRYPADYHGILAYAPAISQEGFAANLTPLLKHIFSAPENWLSAEQIRLYGEKEITACDELDGLKDGIVGNVAACSYDPIELQCQASEVPSHACLTPGQVQSVRMIQSDKKLDVTLADGVVGYPAHGRGAVSSDWPAYFFGSSFAARDAANYILADNIIKHGITNDPNASVMTHDPTRWVKEYLALSNEIDATNPDLSAFYSSGGKLIVWFGLADGCVSYKRTVDYLQNVATHVGSDHYRRFVRFYVSPALGHASTGPGANVFDLMGPLEAWVEKGRAPAKIVAAKQDSTGNVLFSRPLCEYPNFPRYKGRGETSRAESFICAPN
jgi:Tannase and feruloyl esterase